MAGDSAIFRSTLITDTEASLGASEKIEFNAGAIPDSTGRIIQNSFNMRRDVNFHPNPGRVLDYATDSLLGTFEVVLTGYFISHGTTQGPARLKQFMIDPAVNTALQFGRFGIRLDNSFNNTVDLTASATVGYILHFIDIIDAESPRDEVAFIAKLWRNGAIS